MRSCEIRTGGSADRVGWSINGFYGIDNDYLFYNGALIRI